MQREPFPGIPARTRRPKASYWKLTALMFIEARGLLAFHA